MLIALGILNIIYQLLMIVVVGLGGPPCPPGFGLEMLLSLIFYITLSIGIFFRNKKLCNIILTGCAFLTTGVLFSFIFFGLQRKESWFYYLDAMIPIGIIFLLPLIVNFVILKRPKIRERFK